MGTLSPVRPQVGAASHLPFAGAHGHVPGALLHTTCAVVLADEPGSPFMPLTDGHAKPALPFAGALRLIDFALSNCLHSGIRRISVLTQDKAHSLIAHVERGWGFLEPALNEFVNVVPAPQRGGGDECSGHRGTANTVFQNLTTLREADPEHVLVLAGDHVYKMDYGVMLAEHIERGSDITLAGIEVPMAQASTYDVLAVNAQDRVVALQPQPTRPPCIPGTPQRALASMGIYIFKASFLYQALERDAADPHSTHDFARDVIPRALALARAGAPVRVNAHRFARSCVAMQGGQPCWRDMATLDAYWEAHMDLIEVQPQLNLYDDDWPVLSLRRQLEPARFVANHNGLRGMAIDSVVSSGCIVSGATVRRSLLSFKVRVDENSRVEECVVLPGVHIGRGVTLRRCVVDQGCQLPDGFSAGLDAEHDAARFHVTERGITLITADMLGQTRPCSGGAPLQ